tara:strand:+ start:833 stop:1087 length:255 start_codon:yes stop_codon:yes gene_type:complete
MPRILCYDGRPIAVIELLPNNAYGNNKDTSTIQTMIVEGELCGMLSPDEGLADIVDVSDEDLEKLRLGEIVEAVASSCQEDEDD